MTEKEESKTNKEDIIDIEPKIKDKQPDDHNDSGSFSPIDSPDISVDNIIKEVRVAIIGNVDSGKSTLVGVLTKCLLDDGKGYARSLVMNFMHELKTGQTSSIGHEIMCFSDDKQIAPERSTQKHAISWLGLTKKADKIISIIDLCGHEKFLKTTIFGMTALVPDYALIVVGANAGVMKMTKEHLGIAHALKIPYFVVITKVDFAPEEKLKETLDKIKEYLKKVSKQALMVSEKDKELELEKYAESIVTGTVCPIFHVSSKTGQGIEPLRYFISKLSTRSEYMDEINLNDSSVEFLIDSVFTVKNLGVVCSGVLVSGKVKISQGLVIGPNKLGEFRSISIKSIHFKRNEVDEISAGNSCCFLIKSTDSKNPIKREHIRKGMVILDKNNKYKAAREFSAEITVLHCPTTIKPKYQAVIHTGVIRQTASVISMEEELMRGGDSGIVRFRFANSPEFMHVGNRVLIREGRTRALGIVKELHFDKEKEKKK